MTTGDNNSMISTCRLLAVCRKPFAHSFFFLPHLGDFVSLVSITWQVYFGTSDLVSVVLVSLFEEWGKQQQICMFVLGLKGNNGNTFPKTESVLDRWCGLKVFIAIS